MTNKEMEKMAEKALTGMAKKVRDDYKSKNLPHPANKNAIAAFKKTWQKKMDDKIALIDRRQHAGYYDKNPADYQKDYDDVYYARFILRISDDDWNEYLK